MKLEVLAGELRDNSFSNRCRVTLSSPVFHLVVVKSSLCSSASVDLGPYWVTFALKCPTKGMPGHIGKLNQSINQSIKFYFSESMTKPAPFGRVTINSSLKCALPNTPFPSCFLPLF